MKKDYLIEKEETQKALENNIVHKNFINTKTGYLFGHDLPVNKTLEEYYPIMQKKYMRRIQRILSHLDSNKTNLLFYIDSNNADKSCDKIKEEIISSFDKLKNYYSNCNLSLIYFFNDKKTHYPPVVEELSEDILFVRISESLVDFTHFYYMEKFYRNFVKTYIQYKMNIFDILKYLFGEVFLYYFFKIVINFIPLKNLQQKLRAKLKQKNQTTLLQAGDE